MADKLMGMAVFVKTAEAGSFAGAAASLDMSAQMAGKHVSALEKRLGARLLHRSTHSQSLTEAGQAYLEACRRVLAEVEAADDAVARQVQVPAGTLSISAPLGLGSVFLAPRLIGFLRQHPGVTIDLKLSDQIVDLVGGGVDVAIRIGDLPDSSLIVRTLAPYRMITCASPDYLERRGEPENPEDLLQHDCLEYAFPSWPAPHLWCFESAEGLVKVDPPSRFLINDGRALIEGALAGGGVIQTGEIKVADHLAAGRLVRLLSGYSSVARPIQVVYASQTLQPLKVRVFVDWLVGAFAEVREAS